MILVLLTVVLSVLLCGLYLRMARRWQIVDTPNERSSHAGPIPHGGGVALVMALMLALLAKTGLYGAWTVEFIALAIAALLLMSLGVIDDVKGLSAGFRLVVYGLICLVVAQLLLQSLMLEPVFAKVLLMVSVAVAMLWFTNLYNFMDGIDGIAATQAVFACSAAGLLSWQSFGASDYTLFCLLLAASHAGFLLLNWPPAKLFMGDAGSVPSGFLMAALALMGAVQGQLSPWCWLILLALFVTDASWTLLWRIVTGQAFAQAHRSHAYQRLSRRWRSHLKVDLLLLAINLLWLLPLAACAQAWPSHAPFLVILAYLPLLAGMAYMRRLQ